jgi:RsiW-degrading membrane proteinase PrsW (M82 family)
VAMDLIAHGGHALYDHPAMMAISLAALIIPLIVLAFVAKIFLNSAKRDRD